MGIDDFLQLLQRGIETAVFISAPILLLGLAAGLFVSILQAATQINDAALAFIPKIGAAVVGLVFCGNFMIQRLASFTAWVYNQIGSIGP